MALANALLKRNIRATIIGDDPQNESEYLERVTSDEALPSWAELYDEVLAAAQDEYLYNVKIEHAKHLSDLTGNATIEERDTWAVQLSAAVAFLADGNAEDQLFLEGLLTDAEIAAGATAATMADKIIAKSEQTKLLIRMAGKMKREADQAIAAAGTLEELETIIAALKSQEATTLAAYIAAMSS